MAALRSDDLPAPLGPTIAVMLPSRASQETSHRAGTPR